MGRDPNTEKKALHLIRAKAHSASGLAAALGVSWRTVLRLVGRLRDRGFKIVTSREGGRHRYRLETRGRTRPGADPLRALSGFVATGLADGAAHHDRYLYGARESKPRRRGSGGKS